MARRYGRVLRGERCRAPIPIGNWKTTTFVGASVLYLLPYSPDLNPIEQLFAKFKAFLKKRPHEPSTTSKNAITEAIDLFKPIECKGLLMFEDQDAINDAGCQA